MANKSDRISAKQLIASSSSSSVYSISDLDMLPLNGRRASAPLKSFLLAAATLLVVLLTVIVVYLVVSLCHVQRHLTIVNRELTSVSNRLDRVEKKLLSTQKENHTLPDVSRSESATGNNSLTLLQRLPYDRDNRKRHRIGKREAESKSRRSTTTSGGQRRKRSKDSLDRQMRLVYKNFKDIRVEMDSLRNEVAHPSALMVRPNETSNEDYTSTDDNAIPWVVEHNNLFDTQDSTHLRVKTAGTYFIYLQIMYKGQLKSVNPTCSHVVMLQNPMYPTRYKQLLYGSRTQIQLGRVIRYLQKGPDIRAIDTVHQSGIFHLTVGDRIYVKPDDFSYQCIVSPLKHHTFFGAFRLQSAAAVNEYV